MRASAFWQLRVCIPTVTNLRPPRARRGDSVGRSSASAYRYATRQVHALLGVGLMRLDWRKKDSKLVEMVTGRMALTHHRKDRPPHLITMVDHTHP